MVNGEYKIAHAACTADKTISNFYQLHETNICYVAFVDFKIAD